MYNTIITSGPVEVVSTGSVLAYLNNPLEITLELEGFNLILLFKFLNDTNDLTPRQTFSIIENTKLELLLINFNSSLGTGNMVPILIGTSLSKNLWLSFRVYDLEKADKLVHYTIYRSLEGDV